MKQFKGTLSVVTKFFWTPAHVHKVFFIHFASLVHCPMLSAFDVLHMWLVQVWMRVEQREKKTKTDRRVEKCATSFRSSGRKWSVSAIRMYQRQKWTHAQRDVENTIQVLMFVCVCVCVCVPLYVAGVCVPLYVVGVYVPLYVVCVCVSLCLRKKDYSASSWLLCKRTHQQYSEVHCYCIRDLLQCYDPPHIKATHQNVSEILYLFLIV